MWSASSVAASLDRGFCELFERAAQTFRQGTDVADLGLQLEHRLEVEARRDLVDFRVAEVREEPAQHGLDLVRVDLDVDVAPIVAPWDPRASAVGERGE